MQPTENHPEKIEGNSSGIRVIPPGFDELGLNPVLSTSRAAIASKCIHIVKERRLEILECPPWVDRDPESGDLCLFSDEEAFLDIPGEAENLKNADGNLDEIKLGLYLFNTYTDCVRESWLDRYAFIHLMEAHQYADAQAFPYGFMIQLIPFK